MGADRVSDERLAKRVDLWSPRTEEGQALRELLAIRTEAARGRVPAAELVADVQSQSGGGEYIRSDYMTAAIQSDREVGAAAAVALRAERDALRVAASAVEALILSTPSMSGHLSDVRFIHERPDHRVSNAVRALKLALTPTEGQATPPTAGAPEKTDAE